MGSLYSGPLSVSSTAGYIFSGTRAPQAVPGHGRVDGAARPEPALVEDHLGDRPRAEFRRTGRLDRRGERAAAPRRPHPPDREMRAERALLGREAEWGYRPLDRGGERGERGGGAREPDPEDARAGEVREAAESAGREVEGRRGRDGGLERPGHGGHALVRDGAEELERRV